MVGMDWNVHGRAMLWSVLDHYPICSLERYLPSTLQGQALSQVRLSLSNPYKTITSIRVTCLSQSLPFNYTKLFFLKFKKFNSFEISRI